MLLNHLKVAFRNIRHNTIYTLINVSGLALGLACVFFIAIYIQYELGYDKHYPGYDRIYRISWEDQNPQTRTPHPMAQALANDFPEVESAVSLSPLWAAGLTREVFSFRNLEKDVRYDEQNVLAVDTTFFDVFQLPIMMGDAKKALRDVNGILISESMALKYFGHENPIGKQLAVNADTILLEVMAVFQDVPAQSHFHFDFLVSYVREKSFDPNDPYYSWADFGHFNYVRLKEGTDAQELERKIPSWIRKYLTISDVDFSQMQKQGVGFRLQPVSDIHLKSHLRWELEANGNIEYIYLMAGAALLTLIMACINFANLMTAKSSERAREIGIRKSLGAMPNQISLQFLMESALITFFSLVLVFGFVEASIPAYNYFTGQRYQIDYYKIVPMMLLAGVVISLLSGLYPSLVLARLIPHVSLKRGSGTGGEGKVFRNTLIVVQFAISMILLSGAAIIYNQMTFIQNRSLGFDQEQVIVVPLKGENMTELLPAIKNELLRIKGVTAVSASSNLPGGQFNQNDIALSDRPEYRVSSSEALVDPDFVKLMNIPLQQGRFLVKVI